LNSEVIDEGIVLPLRHVVEILDTNYLGNALSFSELLGSDVAHTDMADESLAFEFDEHG